jgi:diguanylate cyclase (GGDEF)-like protein
MPSTVSAEPRDLAGRVRVAQVGLRARLLRRDTLEQLVREAYSEPDPARIAGSLLERMAMWLPASTWLAFSIDETGVMTRLASRGDTLDEAQDFSRVASWVVTHGVMFASSDLGTDVRVPGCQPASAIGFPLACRGRAVGALVGSDPVPCRGEIRLGAGVLPLLLSLLDMVALALDQALRLRKTEALSVTDDLTGLYNSRFLKDALHRETKRAVRYKRPLAVLFIDLDGFKSVNDAHGHLCGSRTLIEAGEVIRACARDSDVVARYGGDEFVVVLPDTPADGAVVVAQRIRDRLAARSFLASEGLDVRLTASVGIAALPDISTDPEPLLQAADAAMYRVKESGKNNYLVAARA